MAPTTGSVASEASVKGEEEASILEKQEQKSIKSRTRSVGPSTRNVSPQKSAKVTVMPSQARHGLKDGYEEPRSNREEWWRCTIKETPIPGTYDSQDSFIDEYRRRPTKYTYNFKSEGRKRSSDPPGKGEYLLPGAYEYKDLLSDLERTRQSYGFKDKGRGNDQGLNAGLADKDIDVYPGQYAMEKYLSLSAEKMPSNHVMFKSVVKRFPTLQFRPKTGPAPGEYENKTTLCASCPAIKSSFSSKSPRFKASQSKTPGPGTYDKTFQSPMPNTISKMGRMHGLFFSSSFQA